MQSLNIIISQLIISIIAILKIIHTLHPIKTPLPHPLTQQAHLTQLHTYTHARTAATLNALIALLGYYAAAHLVDRPSIGRRLLQQYGFLATGTLFSLCALLQNNNSPALLLSLYLLSSFFGQCGPNCTTYLLPAEIFPTEVRTACHGLSASAGKLGALIAATTFHKLDQNNQAGLFWICGVCSFLAAGITFCCIPDTTTLDLYELDREWRMVVDGRDGEYVGPAVDVQHLSFWERRRRSNIGKGGGEKDFKLMGSGVHV